ncbi:MAG: hypothetical protein AAFV07_21065 [Bacteroidota bacterium]
MKPLCVAIFLLLLPVWLGAQAYPPEVWLRSLQPFERAWIELPETAELLGPNQEDGLRIDQVVKDCFDQARKNQPRGRVPTMPLKHYLRQYVVFQLPDGQKYVYVNAGPYTDTGVDSPNHELIMIMDGGPDYWHMTIDLQSGRCLEFYANGES